MLFCLPMIGFGQENKEPSLFTINEAFDKGLLEFIISGASEPQIFREVIDKDGVHYGKCMVITLKSNIDSLILLRIDCGTELIPFDSTFQKMIVTKNVKLPLYPGQTYSTKFYAMCGQILYDMPYIESKYTVGELADSNTVKLAEYFDRNFIQNMIGQHALWAYTDQADLNDLKKYGADSLTIALTTKILNKLSIKTTLNTEEQIDVVLHDNIFEVNKFLVYCTGVLILLLLTSMFYLFRKRKDKIKKS